MEEAEVLADRIAIMADGKLKCCGSSLYLKNRHGVGYYLTIVKQPEVASSEHTQELVNFIKEYVPEAKVDNDIHAEIAFRLPLESSKKFKDLFDNLDRKLKKLKLVSYSISVTTLEEVFIKVAQGSKLEKQTQDAEHKSESSVFLRNTDFVLHRDKIRSSLFFMHYWALIKKRYLISIRDVKSILFEVFIPIITVLIGLGLMMSVARFTDRDSYNLAVSKYEETQNIIYQGTDTAFTAKIISEIDKVDGVSVSNANVDSIEEFDEYLFEERDTDPYRMGSYYISSVDEDNHQYKFVVFHNLTAYQALPTYYQLMSSSILKSIDPDIEINVYNHPLPPTAEMDTVGGDGFIASVIFALGFAFIPAGIITTIVKDKETSVKHQHVISGVSLTAYWSSNLAWDIVKHLLPAIVCASLVAAFGVDALTMDEDRYGGVWGLMILYGVAIAPFCYASSFIFKSHASAQILTIIFHFVAGCLAPSLIFLMLIFEESRDAGKALRWVFRLIPSFCFGFGILNIGALETFSFFLEESDLKPLDIESAGGDLLFMGIDFVLYLIILFIAEYISSKPWIIKSLKRDVKPENEILETDDDVEREEQQALNTNPEDVQINVRNLKQVYHVSGAKPLVAVNDISFNVAKGECFALLGVNGAGKTSTFKILTGEFAPTQGEAYVGGKSITHQLTQVREFIGYCPQFDAITELMTGEEHLNLYCDIKGIPKDVRQQLIEEVLDELDLAKYRNVKSGTYSGGNKRKLSVAIALIGNPKVLFLDEPSAGMDPEARKKMWQVIGNIKRMKSSVVLTTHSMEEAEALCDRMTIMVAGRFKCIGTSTHIKNKFGSGYELEVKVNLPNNHEIETLKSRLSNYMLRDSGDIPEASVEPCLREIGAGALFEEIREHGSGSAIYQQLRTDKKVSILNFVIWAETEKRGTRIYDWLKSIFLRVEPIEHYMALYKFRIHKQEDKSLGNLFSIIEENREDFNIGDYAVTQTSLEQIFNQFARQAEQITPS
jgi:ATP-binding cassette subfamily A (ABC1) protein 3